MKPTIHEYTNINQYNTAKIVLASVYKPIQYSKNSPSVGSHFGYKLVAISKYSLISQQKLILRLKHTLPCQILFQMQLSQTLHLFL